MHAHLVGVHPPSASRARASCNVPSSIIKWKGKLNEIIGLLAYAKSTRTHGWRILLMAPDVYSRKLAEAEMYSRSAKITHGRPMLLSSFEDYSRQDASRTGRGEIA